MVGKKVLTFAMPFHTFSVAESLAHRVFISRGSVPRLDIAMADFLLFEGPMGYSLFKVSHQADTVGNRLKEVQDGMQDLAKFGKMVDLVSFLPFE